MFKELILQNPIISFLSITIPTAVIVWKIIYALYVKPRDFRISTMEKDIDALRNEMLKVEKSDRNAEEKTKKETTNKQKQSEVANNSHEESIRSGLELPIISNTSDLVLNDLQELLNLWNKEGLTDLQKKHIEETYTNKHVVWEVMIKEVEEVKDGKIYVSVISPKATFSLDSAIAYFDERYKETLLLIKKGEAVTISGVIERFFLSPVLKDCQIVRR